MPKQPTNTSLIDRYVDPYTSQYTHPQTSRDGSLRIPDLPGHRTHIDPPIVGEERPGHGRYDTGQEIGLQSASRCLYEIQPAALSREKDPQYQGADHS